MILQNSYILFTICPENSTVVHCLKLLIRLARSGQSVAGLIFDNDLLADIIKTFLIEADERNANYYAKPQHLAMKLVRIVASYQREWCVRFYGLGVSDLLKQYIFVRNNVTVCL